MRSPGVELVDCRGQRLLLHWEIHLQDKKRLLNMKEPTGMRGHGITPVAVVRAADQGRFGSRAASQARQEAVGAAAAAVVH